MILQFRLLKVPIRVHFWFPVTAVALFFLFTEGQDVLRTPAMFIVTVGVLFQGILMHELGHALVARAFGLRPRVELLALGGRTWWEAREPLGPWRALLVSAAGPLVGLFVGFPAFLWILGDPPASPAMIYSIGIFYYVNFVWALFNLLPMLPLDGGNIVAAIFELFSRKHGRRIARYLSLSLLALSAIWLVSVLPLSEPPTMILLLFIGLFAMTNYRALRMEGELARGLADGTVVVATGDREATVRQAHEALERGEGRTVVLLAAHLTGTARDADNRDEGLHLLAWGRFLEGDADEAAAALRSMSGRREPDPALQGAVLLAQGHPDEALPLLFTALEAGDPAKPEDDTATPKDDTATPEIDTAKPEIDTAKPKVDPFVESRIDEALEQCQSWDDSAPRLRTAAPLLSLETLSRLQASSFAAGALRLSQDLGEIAYARSGAPLYAFNVACSLARQERPTEALDWIRRARDAGLEDLELIDTDEDLQAVRALPTWAQFRASLS